MIYLNPNYTLCSETFFIHDELKNNKKSPGIIPLTFYYKKLKCFITAFTSNHEYERHWRQHIKMISGDSHQQWHICDSMPCIFAIVGALYHLNAMSLMFF